MDLKAHAISIPDNKAGDEDATVFITQELDAVLRKRWPSGRLPADHLITDVTADPYEVTKQFKRIAK